MFDFLIVGAGLAGSVIAERIANKLKRNVLIIEKRNHIGGNCYDYFDSYGILIHKYGPHIFHSDNHISWDYLSNFTDWNIYFHKTLGIIDGKKVPIPFNINSLQRLFPASLATKLEKSLIKKYGCNKKIPVLELINTDDKDLKYLANFIYKKVFLNYTKKQWGFKPEELDSSVTERIPIYISKDDRYFQDKYQGTPKQGYAKMVENILSNSRIKILLKTDSKEILKVNHESKKIYFYGKEFKGNIIYTGMIDEFFDYIFGELPYRSLRFNFETYFTEYYQDVGQENYPNEYDFTRITEFKYLTMQKSSNTTIAKEYPQEYKKNEKGKDIPYYPIPKNENKILYEKYKKHSIKYKNLIFIGRLAEYKYYNMNIVVERALEVFKENIINSI